MKITGIAVVGIVLAVLTGFFTGSTALGLLTGSLVPGIAFAADRLVTA